jgi:hypothetical protein
VGEATKDYLKRYEALHTIGVEETSRKPPQDWKNMSVGGGACASDMAAENQQH